MPGIAANWSGDVLPGAGDDVVINVDGRVEWITHDQDVVTEVRSIKCSEAFILSGGTISVTTLWTQHMKLRLQDEGVIDGAGDVLSRQDFRWAGGTMRGSGRTIIDAGSQCLIQKYALSDELHLERVLVNFGELEYHTQGTIEFQNGTLNNRGQMLVDFHPSMTDAGGTNVFANNGTLELRARGVPALQEIGVRFHNTGDLTLSEGQVSFTAGAVFFSGSSFAFAESGSLVYFSGAASVIHSGVAITGTGTIEALGGVTTIDAALSDTLTVIVSGEGAKLYLNQSGTLDRLQSRDGAEAVVSGDVRIARNLYLDDAMIQGPGSLTIESAANAGLLGRVFQRIDLVNEGEIWSVSLAWRPFECSITNSGLMDLGDGTVQVTKGVVPLVNEAGATLTGNPIFLQGPGEMAFVNAGEIVIESDTVQYPTAQFFAGGGSPQGRSRSRTGRTSRWVGRLSIWDRVRSGVTGAG